MAIGSPVWALWARSSRVQMGGTATGVTPGEGGPTVGGGDPGAASAGGGYPSAPAVAGLSETPATAGGKTAVEAGGAAAPGTTPAGGRDPASGAVGQVVAAGSGFRGWPGRGASVRHTTWKPMDGVMAGLLRSTCSRSATSSAGSLWPRMRKRRPGWRRIVRPVGRGHTGPDTGGATGRECP